MAAPLKSMRLASRAPRSISRQIFHGLGSTRYVRLLTRPVSTSSVAPSSASLSTEGGISVGLRQLPSAPQTPHVATASGQERPYGNAGFALAVLVSFFGGLAVDDFMNRQVKTSSNGTNKMP